MSNMFENIGFSNNSLELDLSTFDFSNVDNYTDIFKNIKTTAKVYVADTTA